MRFFLLLLIIVSTSCARTPQTLEEQLDRELRRGGLVIFFVHSDAVHEERIDAPEFDLTDCATHPELSAEGRAQARLLGVHFREREYLVGPVYTSEYCHAAETAKLAFNSAERLGALTLREGESQEEIDIRLRVIRGLLSTVPPSEQENIVLISHGKLLEQATGVHLEEKGRGAVFRPLGSGEFLLEGFLEIP